MNASPQTSRTDPAIAHQVASRRHRETGQKAPAIRDRQTLGTVTCSTYAEIVMKSVVVALKEQKEAVRLIAATAHLVEPATEVHVAHVVEIGLAHRRAEAD